MPRGSQLQSSLLWKLESKKREEEKERLGRKRVYALATREDRPRRLVMRLLLSLSFSLPRPLLPIDLHITR